MKPDWLDVLDPTSIVVFGPPNTGKSHLAASIAQIVPKEKVLLLALRPKEVQSYLYRELEIDTETYFDAGWSPETSEFHALDFDNLIRALRHLYSSDKYDAVIIDPLTDAFELAAHKLLARERVSAPGELQGKGPLKFYGDLRKLALAVVRKLNLLTVGPHPKWVVATMHTRPVEDETLLKQKSAAGKAKGARFEGEVLPMIDGSYKFDMAGDFAVKLYTHVDIHYKNGTQYQVQIQADKEKFAGLGIFPHSPDIDKFLPNNLFKIFETVMAGR